MARSIGIRGLSGGGAPAPPEGPRFQYPADFLPFCRLHAGAYMKPVHGGDMEGWMAIEESKTRLAVEGPQMLPAVEGAEIRMSVEGAEIRMAEGEDDLAAVAAIHSASWQDAYQGVIPSAILASKTSQSLLPGWRATLAAHPGNLRVLVEGGRILGFCCAGSVGDPKKSAPADFEIFGLHVHPGHRRKGLGRRLLKDALARARGPAIVWTLEDLSLSRRFYEREGGIEHSRAVWRCGGFGFREISYLWA